MRLLDWGPQVFTSFRPKTSVTCFMGPSMGQLTTWALAFRRVKEKREHPIKKSPFLCNLISEVTFYHLLHILLIRGKLLSLAHTQGEGIIQGRTTKRQWVESSYRNYHSQTSLKPDMAMWLNSSQWHKSRSFVVDFEKAPKRESGCSSSCHLEHNGWRSSSYFGLWGDLWNGSEGGKTEGAWVCDKMTSWTHPTSPNCLPWESCIFG